MRRLFDLSRHQGRFPLVPVVKQAISSRQTRWPIPGPGRLVKSSSIGIAIPRGDNRLPSFVCATLIGAATKKMEAHVYRARLEGHACHAR